MTDNDILGMLRAQVLGIVAEIGGEWDTATMVEWDQEEYGHTFHYADADCAEMADRVAEDCEECGTSHSGPTASWWLGRQLSVTHRWEGVSKGAAEYAGSEVLVTCGGPHVTVTTTEGVSNVVVRGQWGKESYSATAWDSIGLVDALSECESS